VTVGDERPTVADDVTAAVQLPPPTVDLADTMDWPGSCCRGRRGLAAAGNDWPGFTTADDEEDDDDTTAVACCDVHGMHIIGILSAGRPAGPDFTRTPAVGGALYLLNGAADRMLCIIQPEFVNSGFSIRKYYKMILVNIRK